MKQSKARICAVVIGLLLALVYTRSTMAHRSGCHRWHTCPSDHGMYTTRGSTSTTPTRASSPSTPPSPASAVRMSDPTVGHQSSQSLQELERLADEQTARMDCQREQAMRREDDPNACEWEIYERALLTYCTTVKPQAVRQCMHTTLEGLQADQARQRAQKYESLSMRKKRTGGAMLYIETPGPDERRGWILRGWVEE